MRKAAATSTNQSVEYKDDNFDVAVIGGGSGGISFAREASRLGLQTVLFDYVKESAHKTRWGLGGTCVNVGCIPKKLFHQAAQLGDAVKNSKDYGWELGVNSEEEAPKLTEKFSWEKLVAKVTSYIRSLNFGYKSSLDKEGVTYINGLATLIDSNTILCSKNRAIIEDYLATGNLPTIEVEGKEEPPYTIIRAKNIVIATGTRPTYFSEKQCKGSKLAITSDDIFWMKKKPGATLVVGGGYVAVEIAGFLSELGFKVSMMTRGDYLRGFDRDMVAFILDDLKHRGVNIVPTSLPTSLEKDEAGQITAEIQNQVDKTTTTGKFDTVLFAVGRSANTAELNVEKVGIQVNPKNGKIVTSKDTYDKTNLSNVYALGDVVDGVPELTSTAQKAGVLLARRIAADSGKLKVGKR